jgi:hypothetical protein
MTDQISEPEETYNIKDRHLRTAMNVIGGSIPLGSFLSAIASAWSEKEQEAAIAALHAIIKMLQDEMREKHQTVIEVISRLNMHDEEIRKRIRSDEYQSLMKKALRNWAGVESQKKQEYIRNLLCNAAAVQIVDDDVVKLFIEWLQKYSELHFSVIGIIYKNPGATRYEMWEKLGKKEVREDSAEADLFKLLMRDLSTGGIVRQHRETDYAGNFLRSPRSRSGNRPTSTTTESAFEDTKPYELTALGKQFVHYAMTEVTVKIEYQPATENPQNETSEAA